MKSFVIFLAVLVSARLFAEEAAKPLPEWERAAELSLLLTSGNTKVTTVGLSAAATYRPAPWTFKGKTGFITSSNSGTKTAESFDADLRGERSFSESLSGFTALNYLKNTFAGFNNRYGAEAGVAYAIFADGDHSLGSELGFGVINENRTDSVSQTFGSARAGLAYKWKLSETAELANVFSFLDNLSATSDWRLSNVTSVTAVLTDLLSLKVSFKVDHLNVPVTGKLATDTTTTVALLAKF